MRDCYIGLGSNLGNRGAALVAALAGLRARGLVPTRCSSVWETAPVDVDGGRFWNMVARVPTALEPRALLETLLTLEREAGRIREAAGREGRRAARTLDLDLLLAGDLVVDEPSLRVPHPRMWGRRFVVAPLAEVAPRIRDPRGGPTATEILASMEDGGDVRRLGGLDRLVAGRRFGAKPLASQGDAP